MLCSNNAGVVVQSRAVSATNPQTLLQHIKTTAVKHNSGYTISCACTVANSWKMLNIYLFRYLLIDEKPKHILNVFRAEPTHILDRKWEQHLRPSGRWYSVPRTSLSRYKQSAVPLPIQLINSEPAWVPTAQTHTASHPWAAPPPLTSHYSFMLSGCVQGLDNITAFNCTPPPHYGLYCWSAAAGYVILLAVFASLSWWLPSLEQIVLQGQ